MRVNKFNGVLCIYLIILLMVTIIGVSLVLNNSTYAETTMSEEKDSDTNYLGEDSINEVYVVIDKYHSEPNKKYEKEMFYYSDNIEYIIDLTFKKDLQHFLDKKVEVFRQILYIKLKTETKEELIDFIEANKKIEGILAIDVSRHYKIIFDEIIIEDDTEYIYSYDVEDLW